ncbi:MAG TPA: Ig-like domain-containing protein [Candidatus Thermoplasmatota archaeon]|nr:Ig-like domain-containing protein [Candidatus Thermoplasmatota archaeon]
MRNIVAILLVGSLLCSAFGAVVVSGSETTQVKGDNRGDRSFTHTVFAEDGTATWCHYCQFAAGALKGIYYNGWYPFYYVSLVEDKNVHAQARTTEYNLAGYPTVYFDGGYQVDVGASSIPEAMDTYNSSIMTCGARTVPDIYTSLSVSWLGNAKMSISASVHNNNSAPYAGHIRVYVTEFGSTMGWIDTGGHPYTFAFLDYAFDTSISISSGGTWSNSMTWDGHNYNDGYGHDFGNIQYGNIFVLAAVFNATAHTGYSNPPSGNPFNAYYVDDATGVRVGSNTPPQMPSSPNPSNGSTSVSLTKQISWTGGDVNPFDTVTYDVYFGTSSSPPKVSENQTDLTYNPGTMDFNTTYYWKIVAWDNHGGSTAGPTWHFTTRGESPPNTPSSPSPQNGSTEVDINKDMSWSGGDPDGDSVTYDVYFGTSSPPPKVSSNQSGQSYNPGTMGFVTKYYWKIVAWDYYGETSSGPIWQFTTRDNHPPNTPSGPSPQNNSTGIDINKQLSWVGGDPDPGDIVKYDVFFGTTSSPPKVASNQSGTTYNPGTMNVLTTYYWKIVSWDNYGGKTVGPLWTFTTTEKPNTAPGTPVISGTLKGKTGTSYEYTFTATDADDDDLYYTINWGDNTSEPWVGPIHSGEPLLLNHTWSTKGTYAITAMVTDIHGAESPWGTLSVTMPFSYDPPRHPFLLWLFERFPHAFPILRHLLGY